MKPNAFVILHFAPSTTAPYVCPIFINKLLCMKSVHIRSFSGPYFPVFELNTEILGNCPYSVRMWENTDRKYSKCGHFVQCLSSQIEHIFFKICRCSPRLCTGGNIFILFCNNYKECYFI